MHRANASRAGPASGTQVASGPVFQGILFVLHTGISWEHLPRELSYGSGMTCWRRLAEWTEADLWPRMHEFLLARLRGANALAFTTRPSSLRCSSIQSSSRFTETHDLPGSST
ncbi:transposase [Streptomyces sp. SS1-1]|nr:transposase [Streptomyces sp. SS1-1]